MTDSDTHGPEPIPHKAMYFVYVLVGVLALLVSLWILRML